MKIFDERWQYVVDALGQGLCSDRKARLVGGLEYYKSMVETRIASGEVDVKHCAWLNLGVMPIWTQTVRFNYLNTLSSDIIVDDLVDFIEVHCLNTNGRFSYQEHLSSKSTDREADEMAACALDFVNFCASLRMG